MMAVEFNKTDLARLALLAAQFPRETYRGIGRAGAILRSKMRKIMRSGGGTEGVAKIKGVSTASMFMRRFRGIEGRPLGGVLAKPRAIQMYRRGKGAFTVGFISALEGWARPFQEAETRTLQGGELRLFRMAGSDTNVYSRPARPMVDPFASVALKDLVRWALENTNKILSGARK